MATKQKRTPTGQFVRYERSGAVSVHLRELLRSPIGKNQLSVMREVRTHTEALFPPRNKKLATAK
jgi:hypothetical protein